MWGCTLARSGLTVTEGNADFKALGGPEAMTEVYLQNRLTATGFKATGATLAEGVAAFVDGVTVDLGVGGQRCTALRRWRTGHLSLTADVAGPPDEVLAAYTEDDARRYEYRLVLRPTGGVVLVALKYDGESVVDERRAVLKGEGGAARGQ